jgi:AraC family L-rhamnose operon transcriptional activator RhaR/AraC family L-rhamnose operon regulatory protein RhaS
MPRRLPKPVKFERELVFADRNFPLSVFILDDHPDYPMHVHDFSEIVIISHGRGINVVGSEEFPVKAGDVFVHHGGRPHGYRDTVKLGLINVIYDQSLLQKVRFDVAGLPGYQSLFVVEPAMRREGQFERHLTLDVRDLARARELAEAMEQELYGDAPRLAPVAFEERHRGRSGQGPRKDATGHRFMAVAHFMALVGLLSRTYNTEPTVDSERIMKIGRAIAYMESHFAEDLKLPELAKMVGMSDRNFYRFFSRVKNESPLSYLQRLRVAKGARILQATDKNVTEVAFESGFNDSSYFARQFRRVLGVSPRQFQAGKRMQGRGKK